MSKPVKRKITVSVSPKPKSLTKNRPSVFERLGTKTGTSSLHKEYCHHWAQNGTCPFGKTCKYSSTHTLISPSKQRAAKKESESKKRHPKDNAHKRLPPAPGEEDWDNWDPEELADADPDDLEKRRQELQRELEIQLKMDTKARKKDKKPKRESSPSESSSSSETSSSTDESSSTSSSSVEERKKKAKKTKKRDTSSSSECDRKKHKPTKSTKLLGSAKAKVKTDKMKKCTTLGKTKAVGARSPSPQKNTRKESRTPPLKTKSIPVMRKKSTSRSPRPLSRDKKEKHRSPSPRERDHRDKERDREREQRERDKEREKEKERILEKERDREKERERERLKAKEIRDKVILKKKERSPPKRVDDRKRRDSPERKISPSRSRNGSNGGRRDIHKSPTRDDKRHGGSDYGSSSKRGSGKDNGNISSSSDKQPRSKDIAMKRDHSRDDREREREQLREQREKERRIAREEREAAREKEREEALARCQERQRERERVKAEQMRKAAEEEQKRKAMQIQRRRDDGRDRGLDKPSGDRVERLLPLPSDRLPAGSRRSSIDRDRLGGRDRDRRDRSPIRNRSAGRKSLDRHDGVSRLDHHHNRKDADFESRDHRGSDRSDSGRDYPMRLMDDRDQGRHHRIDDVGKQGRYGSPYDGGRSRSHVDDRRAPGYGDQGCYGDNTREMRLPPSLLDHHSNNSGSDDNRRHSRERDRDHWDERDQRDQQTHRDQHLLERDVDPHRRYNRDDQSRPTIQPLVTIGGGGPPPQQQWPLQSGPVIVGGSGGEFGVALQSDVPTVIQQMQGGQMGGEEWGNHQQQSRSIGPRSNRTIPIEWEPTNASRDNRDWDREQAMQQQPTLSDQQQHIVGGSSGNLSHFTVGGASNRGGCAVDTWQHGGGGDETHVGVAGAGRGNRRWFGRNEDWRDRDRSDRDKGRGVGNAISQRDEAHQDRRKDNILLKQESEAVRTTTLLPIPLESSDSIKKETLSPLKRPAEQPLENATDIKKPCLAPEEPLADDLSEISDDADEILNRDEEILKDEIVETAPEGVIVSANIENHPSAADSQLQEEAKEQKPPLSIVPHSPSKKNQLVPTPQRSASPIRSTKGESSMPEDDHMVDNATMDFEEISEDELEEETRVKGLGDALGVDWASLVAESRPRVKPVTSAKRRWEPHNVLINLGISVEYAGEELVKKIFQLHHNEKLKLEKEAKIEQEISKLPSNPIQLPITEKNADELQGSNNDVTKNVKQELDTNEGVTTIKEEPLDMSNSSLAEDITVKTEPKDTEETSLNDENKFDNEKVDTEVEISHPVAVIQVAMRNKIAIRKSLFASAGPNRRALSARRDLAIRRHLCNLPISDKYVEAPRRHDPEMFRTAMELFSKCL